MRWWVGSVCMVVRMMVACVVVKVVVICVAVRMMVECVVVIRDLCCHPDSVWD